MKPKSLGYIKLDGKSVEHGVFDARKTAEALLGVDELIRSVVVRKLPELANVDFDLPVFVEEGSIIVQIPDNIGDIITNGAVVLVPTSLALIWAKAYLQEAGKLMAKHDFSENGITTVIQGILSLIQDVVRLGKHTHQLGTKEFPNATFELPSNMVGVPSETGQIQKFHRSVLDEYYKFTPQSFARLGKLVQVERELVVGLFDEGREVEERITQREKYIFSPDSEDSDVSLFPELTHGLSVSLPGETTRGTLTTNSIGFRYMGHILNCHPREGNIIRYKDSLFCDCIIHGSIDRTDEDGSLSAKRPTIIFDSLEPVIHTDPPPETRSDPLFPET